ncbi:MAG: hypothetical protein HGA70_10325, partial [Chlorobiaceae bacterium]|nr:hypothetical protein [Chlorobiaceae bacterium]
MNRQPSEYAPLRRLRMPAAQGAVILLLLFAGLFRGAPAVASASQGETVPVTEESFRNRLVAGSIENIKGNFRGAARTYQQLLSEQPSSAALNYALSKAYAGLGAADSARIYAEKSVQLDPSNKYYIGYLA